LHLQPHVPDTSRHEFDYILPSGHDHPVCPDSRIACPRCFTGISRSTYGSPMLFHVFL